MLHKNFIPKSFRFLRREVFPEYKLAKEKCDHLNDLINKSELLTRDPAFYINDYFTKLKNEIDLSKEQKIENIVQKHEQIINELDTELPFCKTVNALLSIESLEIF